MPALVIRLPELDRVSGQRVQGPAGGDQARVRVYFRLGLAEGFVQLGRIVERFGLAADERRGPGGRRPGEEVRGARLASRGGGRAADPDLAALLGQ